MKRNVFHNIVDTSSLYLSDPWGSDARVGEISLCNWEGVSLLEIFVYPMAVSSQIQWASSCREAIGLPTLGLQITTTTKCLLTTWHPARINVKGGVARSVKETSMCMKCVIFSLVRLSREEVYTGKTASSHWKRKMSTYEICVALGRFIL